MATFGPWSSPYDRPAAATYAALTAAGAQRVVLLGASQGAALALATAPRWTRGLRGSSRCPLLPRTQEQIEAFVDRVLST